MRRTVHAFRYGRYIESLDQYLSLYAGAPENCRYIMDGSTGYLYSADAARNIATFSSDAKVVILLRDPVQRAWSEYKMNVAIGIEADSFRVAVSRECRVLRAGGTLLFKRYVLAGLYAEQVRRYSTQFPAEDLFIGVVDRPSEGLPGAIGGLVDFLGLTRPAEILVGHENEARAPLNRALNSALYYSGIKALVSQCVPAAVRAPMRQSYYHADHGPIDEEDAAFIAPLFEDSTCELEALTGLDLGHWRRAR
jgi:hypothetical protein